MEKDLSVQEVKKPHHRKVKKALLALAAIIILVGVGVNMHVRQQDKVDGLTSQIQELRNQLKVKTTKIPSDLKSTSPTTFTYAPRTGGLSLTLAKTYGIIVNVDGNKGGAAGARFRVASAENMSVLSDASYRGLQIDIDNLFYSNNLTQAVQAKESELNEQTTAIRSYDVSDTTVAGLPAKLIKTDGLDEYQGDLSIYLVGSGSFLYTITANGAQNDPFPLLDAVLKGIAIKPVSL